jgi:hypothetical protein
VGRRYIAYLLIVILLGAAAAGLEYLRHNTRDKKIERLRAREKNAREKRLNEKR